MIFYVPSKIIVHYDTSAMKRFLTSVSHTRQENVFSTSIVRNFISRGIKMRISAHEACIKSHFTHGMI